MDGNADRSALFAAQRDANMRKRLHGFMADEGMIQPPSFGEGRGHDMDTGVRWDYVIPQRLLDGFRIFRNRLTGAGTQFRNWVRPPPPGQQDIEAVDLARLRLEANLETDTQSSDALARFIKYFRNEFMPTEASGNLNEAVNNPNDSPTISTWYLGELLKEKARFHEFFCDFFISTGAFVHLSRCPIIFCLGDEDALNLAILCSRKRNEDEQNDPYFSAWIPTYQIGLLIEQERRAGFYVFHPGALMKTLLMNFRTFFMPSSLLPDQNLRTDLSSFFNMGYKDWIKVYLDEYVNPAHPGHEVEAKDVHKLILNPMREIATFVEDKARDDVAQKKGISLRESALKLDKYYSNLVHGAAVRVPLPEIWCPENEMEHTEKDSERFFKVCGKIQIL